MNIEAIDRMVEDNPRMTVGELAALHPIKIYDTALPQPWVDAVKARTGEYPRAFVWCYDQNRTFGAPYPLTAAARALLARYEEAEAERYLDARDARREAAAQEWELNQRNRGG
jgi:hypothetical protein